MGAIRRVFVTGASGKLGGPLCEALLQEGYSVAALRHRQPIGIAGVEEVQGSLSDAQAMARFVSESDPRPRPPEVEDIPPVVSPVDPGAGEPPPVVVLRGIGARPNGNYRWIREQRSVLPRRSLPIRSGRW